MPTVPRISWAELTLGELKGNGSFGDVYKGSWQSKDVAVKVLQIKTLPVHLAEDFESEANLMWECKYPNTLALHGICTESGHYAMVMEYMAQGSLYQKLHGIKEFPMSLRWQIAYDIAQGLAYLHGKNILHCDLKSHNILLDEEYRAKISDFGLARLKLESGSSTTLRKVAGTVRWRAPELFKRRAMHTKETDIYSFGMVLWELASSKLPFSDAQDEVTAMGWIRDGEKEKTPEDCPNVWKEIIQGCWGEPSQRPTAENIVFLLEQNLPMSLRRERISVAVDSPPRTPPRVNPKELTEFLNAVAFGEQDKVEDMLKHNRRLAWASGSLTDCAGRTFNQITGFQYALWALDWHMWRMIKQYLSKEKLRNQLEKINQIATLDEKKGWILRSSQSSDWPSCSWVPLIEALDDYVKNYDVWNGAQRGNHWRQQIGGAQLILPAHVINEYSHTSRPFHPCPEWGGNEPPLPRTGINNWFMQRDVKLGKNFAWTRNGWQKPEWQATSFGLGGWWPGYDTNSYEGRNDMAKHDFIALSNLLKTRTTQYKALISDVALESTTTEIHPQEVVVSAKMLKSAPTPEWFVSKYRSKRVQQESISIESSKKHKEKAQEQPKKEDKEEHDKRDSETAHKHQKSIIDDLVEIFEQASIHEHHSNKKEALVWYEKALEKLMTESDSTSLEEIADLKLKIAAINHDLGLDIKQSIPEPTIAWVPDYRGIAKLPLEEQLKYYLEHEPQVASLSNVDIATYYINMAEVYKNLGKPGCYSNVLKCYEEALKRKKLEYGDNHLSVAETLSALGNIGSELKIFEEALKNHMEAVKIMIKHYGENHLSIANSFDAIGKAYLGLSKNKESIEYFQKALKIQQEKKHVAGSNISLLGIGDAHNNLGNFNEALKYFILCLTTEKENNGINVSVFLQRVGVCYIVSFRQVCVV